MKFEFEFLPQLAYPAAAFFIIGILWLLIKKSSYHRLFSYTLRGLAALLLVVATFDPRFENSSEQKNKLIAVDISDSMDDGTAQKLLTQAKDLAPDAALLPFSSSAAPFPLESSGTATQFLSLKSSWEKLDIGHTNLEYALQQSLLVDSQSRPLASVILVSDGYQNQGNAIAAVEPLTSAGIKIFPLVPQTLSLNQDSLRISNLFTPLIAPAQKSVDVRISISNTFSVTRSGTLVVRHDDHVIFDKTVSIEANSELLVIAQSDPSKEGIKEVQATFSPQDEQLPPSSAVSFLSGETREKVLILAGTADDYRLLIDALRGQSYQVTVQNAPSQGRITNPPILTDYSAIILANIAETQLPPRFDSEVKAYVSGGGGFIMIGGNKSFGLGGYIKSGIADVLPVELLPPRAEEKRLNVAVELVIDKSKSMASDRKLDFAKEAGRTVIAGLKDEDFVGVIGFDNSPFEVVQLGQLANIRGHATERIGRLYPLGGTNPFPAMAEARRRLEGVKAGRKHMILLTDGVIRDAGPEYYEMVKEMRFLGITVSTVMIGIEEDFGFLKNLAQYGGGAYYQTSDASNLPKIFLQDIKVRSGEQTLQEKKDFPVRLGSAGIRSTTLDAFPPLRGYVETKPRERASTELLVMDQDKGKPLLASWQFGKGRSVAYTSDANGRWSNYWAGWNKFTQFWSDLVDSVRPEKGEIATNIRFDLRQRVENGQVILDLSVYSDEVQGTPLATVINPEGKTQEVPYKSISRGRYEAALPNAMAGKYEIHTSFADRKLTPVAFALSGELFGEKKGQGFNVGLLEKIASSSGGSINPSPEIIASNARILTTSEPLAKWFLLAAALILLLEIFIRQILRYRLFRSVRAVSVLLLTVFFLGACSSRGSQKVEIVSPSLSIMSELKRGNVVPNASFEVVEAQKIARWNGSGCETVHSEAARGSRSLLLRALPGETARCVSDQFTVIPGKYDFTAWIKGLDLQLQADRYLNEALLIRLHLFDAQGTELPTLVPFLGQQIDSQDLSYSFNRIDSDQLFSGLGFTHVHLVPRFYPFDAGWLPDEVHAAQIEVTLVGPGTVWLDDFDLHLSKYNLPLQERVKIARESGPHEFLFPTPLEIKSLGDPWPLPKGGIALCFPARESQANRTTATPALARAITDFQKKIQRLAGSSFPVERSCSNDVFTIIIPNTPSQTTKVGHYKIKSFERVGKERGVVLEGSDSSGQVYGLQTLAQLFRSHKSDSGENPMLVFFPSEIDDGPANTFRSVSGRNARMRNYRDEIMASTWLPELRLNTLFIEAQTKQSGWWPINTAALQAVKMLSSTQGDGDAIDLGVLINPYLMRGMSDAGKSFVFSDEQTIEQLYSVIRAFLSPSVKHLIVHSDDFGPRVKGEKFGYALINPADKARFKSLAAAHSYLLSLLTKRLKRDFPETKLYFVPPWYNNVFADLSKGRGYRYLDELCKSIPEEIPILWTGPTVRSLFIDEVHVQRFRAHCPQHEVMLWDNSLYARRDKQYWGSDRAHLDLASYFEPYDVGQPDSTSLPIYMNAHLTQLYRIQLATYAAFLWNPKAYQPEQALWNYLSMRFGEELAQKLLNFDRLVWLSKKYRLEPHATQENVEGQLRELFSQLQTQLPSDEGELLDELRELFIASLSSTALKF